MATKPTAAIALLRGVNGNAYDEDDNPLGLAQGGHRQVFVPALDAVADAGEWTADLAEEVAADRVQTGLDREATADDRVATGEDREAIALDRQASEDAAAAAAAAAGSVDAPALQANIAAARRFSYALNLHLGA